MTYVLHKLNTSVYCHDDDDDDDNETIIDVSNVRVLTDEEDYETKEQKQNSALDVTTEIDLDSNWQKRLDELKKFKHREGGIVECCGDALSVWLPTIFRLLFGCGNCFGIIGC